MHDTVYRLHLVLVCGRTSVRSYRYNIEGDRKWAGNYQSVKGTAVEHDCAIRKPVPYAYDRLVKNSIDRPPLTQLSYAE